MQREREIVKEGVFRVGAGGIGRMVKKYFDFTFGVLSKVVDFYRYLSSNSRCFFWSKRMGEG